MDQGKYILNFICSAHVLKRKSQTGISVIKTQLVLIIFLVSMSTECFKTVPDKNTFDMF